MTNEYTVPHSTSKWSRLSRGSFAVGALARVNNNFKFLRPAARELSASFGLKPVNHNPYLNNIAQLVECLHVVMESMDLIDELAGMTWEGPRQAVAPKKAGGWAPSKCRGGYCITATSSMRTAGSPTATA